MSNSILPTSTGQVGLNKAHSNANAEVPKSASQNPSVSVMTNQAESVKAVEESSKKEKVSTKLTNEQIQEQVNDMLKEHKSDVQLKFDMDKGALRSVQIVDKETEQVVFQFPNEATLALRERLAELVESQQKSNGKAVDFGVLKGILFSRSI